ncbi:Na(+)/H(+) antiporter subunit C [Actinomyces sp. B33]|uniref:Na(+)/H(+) antiporter subunit C n=1 Tax=Actinomyces sp. B33 TaxID=2942131 RepID=UPI0023404DE1|nr:Na(+)/H(+) antiporter subunit C [Actinomyces sp. B33]MDC4233466.1 Na(+)/H(+) antiporter subunit C [Actinomyces sp. B33]
MNSASLTLLLVAGVLAGAGAYLILERSLSRVFIGLGLLTHGVNALLLFAGGPAGRPPLLGSEDPAAMADPLPQAMMLTSIVLSLGTTSFGLALAYRQWRLTGHDEVVDDLEDRWILERSDEVTAAAEAVRGDEDADINYDRDDEDAPDGATPRPEGEGGR